LLSAELRPRPRWGAYSAPSDLFAGYKGPASKGKDGEGDGCGREGERRRREGFGPPSPIINVTSGI